MWGRESSAKAGRQGQAASHGLTARGLPTTRSLSPVPGECYSSCGLDGCLGSAKHVSLSLWAPHPGTQDVLRCLGDCILQ